MLGRVISFVFIPIFIWMLIGGCKEIDKNYNISGDSDFLFKILWLLLVCYATISLFLHAFLNASISIGLKYW